MINLDSYIEDMHTECCLIGNPIVPVKAIKIDGDDDTALKKLLCDNSLKSCDYMKFTNEKVFFVEFSDYYAQLTYLQSLSSNIPTSQISNDVLKKLQKNKILNKEPTAIKNELISKISETMILFELMKTNCSINEHIEKNKVFIISLCKIVISDSIVFDTILRDLNRKFNLVMDIKMFEYTQLETYMNLNA